MNPLTGIHGYKTLYSRDEDGCLPVHFNPDGTYQVERPNQIEEYKTIKALLQALTGRERAPSLNRYFRLTRRLTTPGAKLNTCDEAHIVFEALFRRLPGSFSDVPDGTPDLTPHGVGSGLPGGRSMPPGGGICLGEKALDVKRILYAKFGRWMDTGGYDREEVLQEVYKGILIRNLGKSPWDPRKASFGYYVHMVCSSVLSNYHRKAVKTRGREVVGIREFVNGAMVTVDVASSDRLQKETTTCGTPEQESALERPRARLLGFIMARRSMSHARTLERLTGLLERGEGQATIRGDLGIDKRTYRELVGDLQDLTRQWVAHGRDERSSPTL